MQPLLVDALAYWKREHDRYEDDPDATDMTSVDRAEEVLASVLLRDLNPEQLRALGVFLDQNNAAIDTLRETWNEMSVSA